MTTYKGDKMQGTALSQGILGYTFAGAQVQFDLVTWNNEQYAAWYNPGRNLVIAHRTLNPGGTDGPWTKHTLFEADYNGGGHTYKSHWDSHNWIRLGVSGDGRLHVAADHHSSPMRYWRTSTPGDITTLVRDTTLVSAGLEDSVSYPEFVNKSNGMLGWLVFRDGGSGNGDTVVYKWDNGPAKSWSKVSTMFGATSSYFADGTGNAYHEIFPTLDGWYHIVYNWRETGHASSNSRLSYIKTQDFVTFYNAAGQVLLTPMRGHSEGGSVVDYMPPGVRDTSTTDPDDFTPFNGLVNSEWQFANVGEHRFIAYVKRVAGQDQMFLAHAGADGVWATHQATTVGGIGGMGNGFLDNFMTVIDANTLAVDFALGNKGPQRRLIFNVDTWNQSTYTPGVCPQYYPDAVYPAVDTQPSTDVYARTESDSRCHEQTNGVYNRQYLNTRPVDANTTYVMSWLCGTDRFNAPAIPQSVIDAWPDRPIRVYKITYA